MTRARRFAQQSDITPRPATDNPASGDRFLILVEGSLTEKRYFEEMCGQMQFSAYDVTIKAPDSDPLNLVKTATKLRLAMQKLDAEGNNVAYDQVWVVCDREEKNHHRTDRLHEAILLADAEKILFALSNPSFEYWLLLHQCYSHTPLYNSDAAEKALSAIQMENDLPEYDKAEYPVQFYVTPDKVKAACKSTDKIRKYHQKGGGADWCKDHVFAREGAEQSEGNPSTDVDQLVRQLNLATNPHFRWIPFNEINSPAFT